MTEIVIDQHGRPQPPRLAGEVGTLFGFLDFHRATLEWKCRDLTDEQMRIPLPPTSMTMGGLLKHLAWAEDLWFTQVVADQPMPEPWSDRESLIIHHDWEWTSAADDPGTRLRTLWDDAVQRSREIVASELAVGEDRALATVHLTPLSKTRVSLRFVVLHMIEEYARHNGHADLIRESIDGRTGE